MDGTDNLIVVYGPCAGAFRVRGIVWSDTADEVAAFGASVMASLNALEV